MAKLDQFLKEAVPAVVYDESFMDVLEDHLTWFKTSSKTTTVAVTPNQADVYSFDLAGLLIALNVPLRVHWLVMRMNDYTSFCENDNTLTSLLLPDLATFDQLSQVQQATLQAQASAVQ